jgi:hypothetical protein
MKKLSLFACIAMLGLYSPNLTYAYDDSAIYDGSKKRYSSNPENQLEGEYKTLDGEVKATFSQEVSDEIGFDVRAKFPHNWFEQKAYHKSKTPSEIIVYNKKNEILFTMKKNGFPVLGEWHYSGVCGEVGFPDTKIILELYDVEWYLVVAEKADIWKDGQDHLSIIVPADKYKRIEKACKILKKSKK